MTAPRHPQVLAHSLLDMHINTGLHTFTHTHTHTHRSINISEIFLKRLPIKTHRKFTALPTCASQGLQVPPKKEEITRQEVAWPLPWQANTYGLSAANLPHVPSLSPTVPGSSELHFFHPSPYGILNPSLQIQLSVTTYFA